MEEMMTDPGLLASLERAANRLMTPAERRAQARSWIRGQTGATDEEIDTHCPDLREPNPDEEKAKLARHAPKL